MMIRRLLPGIWRRRDYDDQDDVAVAIEESTGPRGVRGRGVRRPERQAPPNAPASPSPPPLAAIVARKRRKMAEELARRAVDLRLHLVGHAGWVEAKVATERPAEVEPQRRQKPARSEPPAIPVASFGVRVRAPAGYVLAQMVAIPGDLVLGVGCYSGASLVRCLIETKTGSPQKQLLQLFQMGEL